MRLKISLKNFGASDEPDTEWASGPFNEGARARIDGFGRRHAPNADAVGAHARNSWLAGWSDADMGIISDELADSMPVTK